MAVCTICKHAERATIENLLLRNVSLRRLAAQTNTSAGALHRHKQHMPGRLAKATQAEIVTEATSLLSRVEDLMKESEAIATAAKKQKNWAAATSALREARGCLELLGKIRGELQTGTSVKIGVGVQVAVESSPVPANEEELELRIARQIGELTNGYDERELARLKALCEGVSGASGKHGSENLLCG